MTMECVYLLKALELALHALNGHNFACFYMLGFENLRKGAFSFLAD